VYFGGDGPRLFDPSGGNPHIETLDQSGPHQFLEAVIPVNIPPGGIGQCRRARSRLIAEGSRHLDRGTLIVGADRATCKEQRRHNRRRRVP